MSLYKPRPECLGYPALLAPSNLLFMAVTLEPQRKTETSLPSQVNSAATSLYLMGGLNRARTLYSQKELVACTTRGLCGAAECARSNKWATTQKA